MPNIQTKSDFELELQAFNGELALEGFRIQDLVALVVANKSRYTGANISQPIRIEPPTTRAISKLAARFKNTAGGDYIRAIDRR